MSNDLNDALTGMYVCLSGLFDKSELQKGNINYLNQQINTLSATVLTLGNIDPSALENFTINTNADIWAEGTDEQVASISGEHSAKGWAMVALSAINVITGYMQTVEELNASLSSYDARQTRY